MKGALRHWLKFILLDLLQQRSDIEMESSNTVIVIIYTTKKLVFFYKKSVY